MLNGIELLTIFKILLLFLWQRKFELLRNKIFTLFIFKVISQLLKTSPSVQSDKVLDTDKIHNKLNFVLCIDYDVSCKK